MSYTAARNDELVDLIYSALLGETPWSAFMEKLVDPSGDGWAALVSHDARDSEGMFGSYFGCDDTLVQDYESHYAAINPWAPQCVVKAAGMAVTGNDLVQRDAFVKTEFYNDFFRNHGTQDGAGISILKEEDRAMMLSVMTANADHAANIRMSETLGYLYPHLRRAADYYKRGRDSASSLGFGSTLFEAIDVGTVVVGQGCRPKSISVSASEMIAASKSLNISPIGRFRILDEQANKVLAGMLAHNYAGPHTKSFLLSDVKMTLVKMKKERISWYFEGPTVVALLEPLKPMAQAFDPDWFGQAFGLTRAELRALIGVKDGKSLQEIAVAAGLSRETIRSQMKSLYLKTGVNSQSGLLRLLHSPLSEK